jgi:hypothetical protein
MSRLVEYSVLAISLIMVAVIAAGCSSRFVPQREEEASPPSPSSGSSHQPTKGLVQSSSGGAVTIDIEWDKAEYGSLIFNVAMNTHSVDLDQYDLGELAVLRDNGGKEYHPTSWESAPGGHHRRGVLGFPLPESLSQGKTEYVEMVIRDVAGIKERVLRWEL